MHTGGGGQQPPHAPRPHMVREAGRGEGGAEVAGKAGRGGGGGAEKGVQGVCGVADDRNEGEKRVQRGGNAIDCPQCAPRPSGKVGGSTAPGTRTRGTGGQPPAGNGGGRGAGERRRGACVLAGRGTPPRPLRADTLVPERRPAGQAGGGRQRQPEVAHLADTPPPPLRSLLRLGRRRPAGRQAGPLTPPGGRGGMPPRQRRSRRGGQPPASPASGRAPG